MSSRSFVSCLDSLCTKETEFEIHELSLERSQART